MARFWTNIAYEGNVILLREVEDGRRSKRRIEYQPTLYQEVDYDTPFKSIFGHSLEPVKMKSISSARLAASGKFTKKVKVGDKEEDVPEIYFGYDRWPYTFLAKEYPGVIDYDPSQVLVAYLDIETMADSGMPDITAADKEVTAITFKVGDRIFIFGTRDYIAKEEETYIKCVNEAALLNTFISVWERNYPDIVSGWNIEFFDIPYLANRIDRILGKGQAKRLSPWNLLEKKKVISRGQEKEVFDPVGISILDYQRLYHKLAVMTRAVDTPDDYKLNTIASVEVDEKKIDYSEFQSLHELWLNDHQKYIEYNVHDVLLVEKINEKRQLIELVMAMAYNAKVNFEDMLGSVRPWECIIHHELLSQNIILPPRHSSEKEELIGAYVKDPEPQAFEWVLSFDLNSLYSHLIMEWNISPETPIGELSKRLTIDEILDGGLLPFKPELEELNAIVAGNMRLFDRTRKGLLPKILETMYDARVVAKQSAIAAEKNYEKTKDPAYKKQAAMWKNMDKVHKTNLNAAYGVLTNQWFLFYDHGNAEAITMSGQLAIRWVEKKVNEFLQTIMGPGDYIIAMDTDSIYVNLGPMVKKFYPDRSKNETADFLVGVERKIEEVIDNCYAELADMVNAKEQKMKMKRETIADLGIWIGKKHYILNMIDKEGVRYNTPKIEIKGISAVKSSTPPACREKIKDAIKIIMAGEKDKMSSFVSDFRNEFETLPFGAIAFPRGVNEIDKWMKGAAMHLYAPGTPIQVRAAILYNAFIKRMGLHEYPECYSGDKIKFCYLRTPNPYSENVFGTPGPLPKGISDYIDRDLMFDKGFMVPLKSILEAIGWDTEVKDENVLDSFFV